MQNDVRYFLDLLWGMTEKELQARYKHTVFGFLWLVVNPIIQMVVIGFVFSLFMKESIDHYYHHLFTGLLIWNFFSLSLTKITPSIVYERSLIKKSAFPRLVIPLSILLSNVIHFTLALAIFLIPIAMLGTLHVQSWAYLVFGYGLLLLFVTGMSLITSALNVRYRDVQFFVQAMLIPWFYATPIVYSIAQIPPGMHWAWKFNPMTSILQVFHHALLSERAADSTQLLIHTLSIVALLGTGILIFITESKTFDDWI